VAEHPEVWADGSEFEFQDKTGSLSSSLRGSPGPDHGYEVITIPPERVDTAGSEAEAVSTAEKKEDSLPAKLEPHKIGIQNKGNTCYLNSTVQALLGLPMLVTDAVNLKFSIEKLALSTEGSRLVTPFTSICLAQSRGEVARTNANAMRLKKDMEQLDSQFAGNKMQDANEFLCRFLDEMKENVTKIFSENGNDKELGVEDDTGRQHRLTNLVDSNFQYEREETFACCACGHRSHVKHSDVNFFCDLSDSSVSCSVSLQQLVERTLAPETREKRCDSEQCGHETANTETKVTKLPRVLLLFLKRYKYMAVGGGTVTTSTRKVTRLVDIPASINLDNIVSEDVLTPDSILAESVVINDSPEIGSVDSSNVPVPATPKKSVHISVPYEGLGTPIKFKGKTEEELSKLSEEEQTEYLLYISQKEVLTSHGREIVFENEDEDEELKAALEASLLDVGGDEDEKKAAGGEKKSEEFKTPLKRQLSLSSLDSSGPPSKVARHKGGVFSHSTESLLARADTPSPPKSSSDTPGEKKVSWKKSFHRPESQAEEDADMMRALELSTQGEVETTMETEVAGEAEQKESESDEVTEEVTEEDSEGEHCYRLTSVVSHFGASTAAGHYVADVHRFDAGGWYRYDDTVVTETNINSVRSGSNKANGYIFMYVHKSLWDQCSLKYNNSKSNCSQPSVICDSNSSV